MALSINVEIRLSDRRDHLQEERYWSDAVNESDLVHLEKFADAMRSKILERVEEARRDRKLADSST